ncbi:DUF4190 domain-containing protein [Solihabitans fulvus]|uniref:DUF4190 domain-containing protein n=2 Tax=Solihabitans fulvus TaxID=1892852 RepID=A0A5B2XMH2_9PSEU|nr:DUF4190 domain-containing protein [Solihabitans fulvus]
MAILALVFAFLAAPLGLVFGFIAKSQIKRTGEDGDGLATAGIIVGAVFTALWVLFMIIGLVFFATAVNVIHDVGTHVPTSPTMTS